MILNSCLKSFLLLYLSSTVTSICPNGWTKYDQSCYALYKMKASWIDAGSYCREFGGHLATLNTTSKVTNIKSFLNYVNQNANVWVGGNDLRSEGMWVWDVDQASFTHTDWHPGQPNGGSEHCLELYQPTHFTWHDSTCSNKYDYICERRSEASS
ncbi:perlucin-like [Haliotis cracherodii]|uniref:perlucin-like n=1 Tax=Haliotis cracherodii TaxID=6455 RepID=UPI0039EC02D2